MIIYNSAWSILIKLVRVMIVRWQSYLVNTKECVVHVCDQSYHTNKSTAQNEKEIEVLRNYALASSVYYAKNTLPQPQVIFLYKFFVFLSKNPTGFLWLMLLRKEHLFGWVIGQIPSFITGRARSPTTSVQVRSSCNTCDFYFLMKCKCTYYRQLIEIKSVA